MTGKRASDSVGKCPPLSEDVLARAVEAACAGFIPEWGRLPNSEAQDWRSDLSHGLAAAAPIIAEAAYRAGIEEAEIELSREREARIQSDIRIMRLEAGIRQLITEFHKAAAIRTEDKLCALFGGTWIGEVPPDAERRYRAAMEEREVEAYPPLAECSTSVIEGWVRAALTDTEGRDE